MESVLKPTEKWKQHLEKYAPPSLEQLLARVLDLECKRRNLKNSVEYMGIEIGRISKQIDEMQKA